MIHENAVVTRPLTRHQRAPGRDANRTRGISATEPDTGRTDPIQVWRLQNRVAFNSERVTALLVSHQQKNVWLVAHDGPRFQTS